MIKTYPLFIGGDNVTTGKWTYTLPASNWIDAPLPTLTLKRNLELGKEEPEIHAEAIVGRCALGTGNENQRALQAASEAAKAFARFPLKLRLEMAEKIRIRIEENFDALVEILIAEGHPKKLARWEISGIINGLAPETLEWLAPQMEQNISLPGRSIKMVRKPDGVVCLNPPQNAAASNSALGIYALFAGNSLVIKAPRSCPLGVNFLYRELVQPVLEEIDAPSGLLNIISGNSQEIISEWLNSPHVADIFYFGGSRTGIKLGKDCISKGKKPILELSGNDAFTVWHDADLKKASDTLIEAFYGSSQICMVPKLAILHPDIADEFLALLIEKVRNVRPGYPEDPETILSPVLKAHEFFESLTEATSAGCEVLVGGDRVDIKGSVNHMGAFVEPTIVRVNGFTLASQLNCVMEETFFPLLSVVVPDKNEEIFDQLLNFLQKNQYGLRNSFWSSDERLIEEYVGQLNNVGQIKINESHIGFVPVISTHGGPGLTGGPNGELNYVALRTSHLQGISKTD